MKKVKMSKGNQSVEVLSDQVPTMLNRGYKEVNSKPQKKTLIKQEVKKDG